MVKITKKYTMKHIKKYLIVIPMLVSFGYLNAMDTAFTWAIHNDHPNVARLLIAAGANVNLFDQYGYTALMDAAVSNRPEIVRLLIAADANVDLITQNDGYTALILATQHNSAEIAERLIVAGAQIDLANQSGYTALMKAARRNCTEIASLLIAAGANLDLVNQNGYTALMVAAISNRPEIASLLIAAGADPTIQPPPTTEYPSRRFAHQLVPAGDTPEKIIQNNALRTELEDWYEQYTNSSLK